jgi:hypothetical protein
MRLPDFVLSMDGLSVIRITDPSFELRLLADQEESNLPTPVTVCELSEGQRFGVVAWLGDTAPYRLGELERFALRGAEYLVERWNEGAPAD